MYHYAYVYVCERGHASARTGKCTKSSALLCRRPNSCPSSRIFLLCVSVDQGYRHAGFAAIAWIVIVIYSTAFIASIVIKTLRTATRVLGLLCRGFVELVTLMLQLSLMLVTLPIEGIRATCAWVVNAAMELTGHGPDGHRTPLQRHAGAPFQLSAPRPWRGAADGARCCVCATRVADCTLGTTWVARDCQ